jgi:hypothetical protein
MIDMTPEQAHIVYQTTTSQGWKTVLSILEADKKEIEQHLINPKVAHDFTQYYRGALATLLNIFDLNQLAFNVINEAAQRQKRKEESDE